MVVPTAYIETNIAFRLAREDHANEVKPLHRILSAYKEGRIVLRSSSVTRKELDQGDPGVEDSIYNLLLDVPTVEGEAVYPRVVKAGSQVYPLPWSSQTRI